MIDNEISFRKLQIFIAFMNERNIRRTAEKLDLSTVAVHRALHSLEDSIECPLFTNVGRNLVPLDSAIELLKHARQSINDLHTGISVAQEMAGFEGKSLRIGALCSLVPDVLSTILAGMKARKKDLSIQIVTGGNNNLITKLQDKEIDAAIIGSPYSYISGMQTVSLFQDEIYFACSSRSPLAKLKEVDLAELKDDSFISLSEGFSVFAHYNEAFKLANFTPNTVARVQDIFSMLHLVANNIGYTLMPYRMKRVCKNNEVTLIRLALPYRLHQDILLIFAANREKNPNILALMAECRMYHHKLR